MESEKPRQTVIGCTYDTTVTTSTKMDPYASVPWEPPIAIQAGGWVMFTGDGVTAGVYGPDGHLVEVYELRDGAMRPKAEETQ